MKPRSTRLAIGTTVLLMFSIAQVYVGVSFAGPDTRPRRVVATQDLTGILITSGTQAVLVNGNNAVTDATILSGASIESPQGVSATVNLGRLGRLDIAPATSLRLDFSAGSIKVMLFKGCVVLHTRRNTTGTIATPNGVVGTTNPSKDDVIDVCQREGAPAAIVNQGAAANAGAGAGSVTSGTSAGTIAGGTSSAGGLSQAAGAVIGGIGMSALIVAALVLPCDRARNPSPAQGPKQCR